MMMDWEAPQPPLLQLPAELRNEIYKEALLSKSWIKITASGVPEPGLLRVCKQTRRECMQMFYNEGWFDIDIVDYDSSILVKWTKFYRELRRKYGVEVKLCGPFGWETWNPNWENLKLWLKRNHEHTVSMRFRRPSTGASFSSSLDGLVIGGMFQIVQAMMFNSWRDVERLLDEQHCILVEIDPRWK